MRIVLSLGFTILLALLLPTPVGIADTDGTAVNGRFTAFSDGQWAKTNEKFRDEASVTDTWTITSQCANAFECTGQIVSDRGWTAELRYLSGQWRAWHTVANWQPCPDGTTAPGRQDFTFWPARTNEYHAAVLTGWDETVGPSGACGVNRSLTIRMPLRLTRIE